jgi:hypothetical protein
MRKIVLTFGLIAGAILSLMMAISMAFHDQIGFDRGMIVGYTSMVLSFLLVYFGVRRYRDTVAGGTIGFWRAFFVGFLITAVASLCYVVAWEVLSHFYMQDYMDKYAAYALAKAQAAGATPEQLAAQAQEMARFKALYANPFIKAAFTFLEPLPVALVMSLLSAGLLRRRGESPERIPVGSTAPAL